MLKSPLTEKVQDNEFDKIQYILEYHMILVLNIFLKYPHRINCIRNPDE